MDHLVASQSQAVEKYLLDQLHGAEREQFEDHFFECEICAEEIRTGVLLLDNAAAEFQAAPAPAKASQKKRSWLDSFRIDWRQPAFALPLLALVAVSGLWMRDRHQIQQFQSQLLAPQVFNGVDIESIHGASERGAKAISANVKRGDNASAVSFFIDSPPLPTYTLKIDGNGVAPAAILLTQHSDNEAYGVLLPSARYKPGLYRFTILGGSGTDAPFVGQFTLTLK